MPLPQILAYLLEYAGIPYRVVQYASDLDWGTPVPNASQPCAFSGAIGLLPVPLPRLTIEMTGDVIEGRVHTISTEYTITPERSACLTFANPTIYE